jgi:hypothetical protein
MARIGDVAMGLVFVALATTLVIHKNTASVINAGGSAFSTSIKAAVNG